MDDSMEDGVDEYAECLNSGCSSDNDVIFGDPKLLPRVGDQYQVEIPHPLMEYERLQLIRELTDMEVKLDFSNYFKIGLSIPIMWVRVESEIIENEAMEYNGSRDDPVNKNGCTESESSQESQITLNGRDAKLECEPLDTTLDYAEGAGGLSNLQPVVDVHQKDAELIIPQEKKTKLDRLDSGSHVCVPLPGLMTDTWRDIEYDKFLLGLYIFGKNLYLVKKFVDIKKMGDVLSHYYGRFYKSVEYLKWSEHRKMKSRRTVQGHKIFTGWRHQELLSRIVSHVSEECKNMLIEVSRKFGEGKLSLEDYVFTLKDMVGANLLVEIVAIGKGKQDITGTALERVKTNHVLPIRPEMPIGKAFSSLTKEEIIKFLTGNFRLSKTRSSDLFWEAVWPRLLARGWHSEQPRNYIHTGSTYSLVFLIPGVKKFSRRKLVKGNHYFDSVSDVLNKVAAEPELLEFESIKVSSDEDEIKSDSEGLPNRQRHCYLQPRNSNYNRDSLKFTIVDTSLVSGEERVKVRELRSLPDDPIYDSPLSSISSETEQDSTKESQDEAKVINSPKLVENKTENGTCAHLAECPSSSVNNHMPKSPDVTIATRKNHKDQSTSLLNERQSNKTLKFQFSRKGKGAITKHNQLTAPKLGDSSHGVENISISAKPDGEELSSPSRCEIRASTNSLACSTQDSSKEAINTICMDNDPSHEKTCSQILIDLNDLPQVYPDSDTHDLDHKNDYSSTLTPSNNGSGLEQQTAVNGRRQSTRNRPLTIKALEALSYGYLSPKRKREGVKGLSKNNPKSNSSRRVHEKTDISTSNIDVSCKNDACDRVEEKVDGDTKMEHVFHN